MVSGYIREAKSPEVYVYSDEVMGGVCTHQTVFSDEELEEYSVQYTYLWFIG